MLEIYAQVFFIDKETIKSYPINMIGPTEVGWYIIVGDKDKPCGIYPHVFKTKQDAEANVEKAILEFVMAQNLDTERTTVH